MTDKALTNRKRLFEILTNFCRNQASTKDKLNLAEILIYETPYPNNIVYKTNRKDLKIKLANLGIKDGLYDNGRLRLNINIDEFLEFLFTVGHEYTHYVQHVIFKNLMDDPELQISPEIREIAFLSQSNINDITLLPIIKTLAQYKPTKEQAEQLNCLFYNISPYEINANKCQLLYAKQTLEALKNDELCSAELKAFLEKCEKQWDENLQLYKNEEKDLDKFVDDFYPEYRTIAKDFAKIPTEMAIELPNKQIRKLVMNNKLGYMICMNCSDKEFFEALFKFKLTFNKDYNDYKNINKNLKELTIDFLKNASDDDVYCVPALFANMKINNKLLELKDFNDVCLSWGKEHKVNLLSSFITTLYHEKKVIKFIGKQKAFEIISSLAQDQELKVLIDENIDNYTEVLQEDNDQTLQESIDDLRLSAAINNLIVAKNVLDSMEFAINKVKSQNEENS